MAGKPSKNGKTRAFTSVNYSAARMAREKQKREIEQQKKEKIIFVLFVVIILVMILFAILIFKSILSGGGEAATTDRETTIETSAESGGTDTESLPAGSFENVKVVNNDIHKGNLLLIDSSHSYKKTETLDLQNIYHGRNKFDKASAANGYVYSYYTAGSEGDLEANTLAALNAMADEFYRVKGNNDLYVHTPSCAYVRDASDDHATGRAFDLSVYTIEKVRYELNSTAISPDFDWIKQNYYKYGFVHYTDSGCDAVYHLLYVGVPHAYYMYKNDLSLEAYLEQLRTKHSYTAGGKNALVFTADDGLEYQVYYVASIGDETMVPVPTDRPYTISGDNVSGFVVTVMPK